MAEYSDEFLQGLSEAKLFDLVNTGHLTVNQYRRAKGWPTIETPDGDDIITKYSQLGRHDLSTPRFDELEDKINFEEIYEKAREALSKNGPPVVLNEPPKDTQDGSFAYGLAAGLILSTGFWAVFTLLLWLILR